MTADAPVHQQTVSQMSQVDADDGKRVPGTKEKLLRERLLSYRLLSKTITVIQ